MGQSCYRSHSQGVRLRSLQAEAKLNKEMRTLNAYLKRTPSSLTRAEQEEMMSLDEAGVDL